MFAAEFEPAETEGRRRSPRAPVSFDASIGKAGRTLCKVLDISIHGCRLQTYSSLGQGDVIWITIPDVGSLAADVKWAEEFVAGCQFREPLTIGQFELLIDRDSDAARPAR